ncbi:Golgi transport complex subunit 5-domain-containing protein [Gigaspora margarita]|uniref:Conserved oligomeric Golgi complex subunit 5 n=1 Tax=Gigaspora margarita TaxID=4874 RepID=A0A8H4A1A0_GIGMA|nr:Golgi transport complex subunit 5-domain-containing protein [Gigaspora margarita]
MTSNLPESDLYIDYKAFLSNNFDPKEYANSTVNSTSDGEGDITISLAKLSFSIDNLNKQLHDQVVTHFEDLILQAAGIRDLEIVLNSVKEGINSLNTSLDRLKTKIYTPYSQIKNYIIQLERLQIASGLLRKVVRFFYLARCLENSLIDTNNESEKCNEYIKAASNISELEVLLKDADFEGIDLVQAQLPKIQQSKTKILNEALRLLTEGIDNQKEVDISFGLQIFYELNEIGERVSKYVDDIFAKLLEKMKYAVDSASIQKEIKDFGVTPMKGIRRLGSEPTAGSSITFTSTLWKRMEVLMDNIAESCNKIYILENVLANEKDAMTQVSYLDEVAKTLDGGLIQHFWKTLSLNFERELKESTKGSSFMRQAFITGYSKLLRLFQNLFAKLEKQGYLKLDGDFQSQETAVMLHSISSYAS